MISNFILFASVQVILKCQMIVLPLSFLPFFE
jgi:hypothetical protein